jgi:uroporphyrin-III C-methyltransferase/precorrin-2 dehydrogenase/sirohydrochlorin ferrochelatase
MDYLPIFFKISQKQCLVVGGGDIALRKINLLLKSGALVECVAPSFCQTLLERSVDDTLTLTKKTAGQFQF